MATGIWKRHSRRCRSRGGAACNCSPSWEAQVFDQRTSKRKRKSFETEGAAKDWRAEQMIGLRRGTISTQTNTTLRAAAEQWLAGAKAGTIRSRTGETFKPSVIRGYESALNARILPELGSHKLAAIRRVDLQDFADELLAKGGEDANGDPCPLDPSTVRNLLMPLRAIYRRALVRGEVAVNPTTGLELPAPKGRRDRIASPAEATELLSTLPLDLRALYGVAMFGGLRLGEARALRWADVDLAAGVIRVERSWDPKAGPVAPKSEAGKREVPIIAALRTILLEHQLGSGRREGLVFGRSSERPFADASVRLRVSKAWEAANAKRAEAELPLLEPIGLHEARHTFASTLIAAGVNVKAISTYMGHSSITITLDRYGHLLDDHAETAVAKVDEFLAAAQTAAQGG